MQIGFKLAKPGLMKDFAGQWTIQPLMQKDLMSSQRSDQLKGLSGVMYSFVSHACCWVVEGKLYGAVCYIVCFMEPSVTLLAAVVTVNISCKCSSICATCKCMSHVCRCMTHTDADVHSSICWHIWQMFHVQFPCIIYKPDNELTLFFNSSSAVEAQDKFPLCCRWSTKLSEHTAFPESSEFFRDPWAVHSSCFCATKASGQSSERCAKHATVESLQHTQFA